MTEQKKNLEQRINETRSHHKKAWGYEDWIVNNKQQGYCGKLLSLNEGYQCSLHMHEIKSEVFYVNKGLVLIQAYNEEKVMWPGESLEIVPGTWHRFIGLTNAEIMEFSSHHEEKDSHRDTDKLSGRVPDEEWSEYLNIYKENIDYYFNEENSDIDDNFLDWTTYH
ncbi:cupin domain-containing protein [Candidatus Woesearchaeota archaeon]|nr:cupin domain-containing protein [Candidatus Woesearchaeota archaeon]